MAAQLRKVQNPPNPFDRYGVEWLGEPPTASVQVFEERAKSILTKNDSPDIPFQYGVNPYRGCFHACSYCYARPTHQYVDFVAGTDFDTKVVAKVNAPELLRIAFEKKSWNGEAIMFSGITDCYQPLEGIYELTKKCLEVCLEYRNPVCIITKSALIQRDIELLAELSEVSSVVVHFSLAFSDPEMARKIEPHTPTPAARIRAMKKLHQAGVRVGVAASPVIPGLNDSQIPRVLEWATEAGATSAFMTLLRLPGVVKDVFFERLGTQYPARVKRVENALLEMRQGKLNRTEYGKRMVGEGERWEATEWLFRRSCDKLGLQYYREDGERISVIKKESTFRRPQAQLRLWNEEKGK